MSPKEALHLIQPAVKSPTRTWADIGAGTGVFTLALRELLTEGTIYAVDKSPHALWRLPLNGEVAIKIVEGDFTKNMELPVVENILMANALHYAEAPIPVLKNVLTHLKTGGQFILIEYETERAIPQWVPYPIPFSSFQKIAAACGLSEPHEIGRTPSMYGHEHIYSAVCRTHGGRNSFRPPNKTE